MQNSIEIVTVGVPVRPKNWCKERTRVKRQIGNAYARLNRNRATWGPETARHLVQGTHPGKTRKVEDENAELD